MATEVLRRSRKTSEASRLAGPAQGLVVLGAVLVGSRAGFLGGIVGLVAGLVALVALRRAVRKVGVELDDDGVAYRGVLRTRHWPWSEVGSVLEASEVRATAAQPAVDWVVVRGRRGRRLFQLTSTTWPAAVRERLVGRVGEHAQVLHEPGPSTLREVAARHRGAFSLAQRRPVLTSVVSSLAVCVVAIGGSYLGYQWWGQR